MHVSKGRARRRRRCGAAGARLRSRSRGRGAAGVTGGAGVVCGRPPGLAWGAGAQNGAHGRSPPGVREVREVEEDRGLRSCLQAEGGALSRGPGGG